MAFPFFTEGHPAMTVEHYAYMQRLWQYQLEHQRPSTAETVEHEQSDSSSSCSDQSSLRSQSPHSPHSPQLPTKRRLADIFARAKLRRAKSLHGPIPDLRSNGTNHDGDIVSPPNASHGCKDDTHITYQRSDFPNRSTSITPHYSDPVDQVLSLCASHLTNPFSRQFELNLLLLNVTHPLLSKRHQKGQGRRILDLGGSPESVYSKTLAALPGAAVCQFTQAQLESRDPSLRLPFAPNSFDVISTRSLYRCMSNSRGDSRLPTPQQCEDSLRSYVRDIYRVLDTAGSIEYVFFDQQLTHAGPLTQELEPFLYGDSNNLRTPNMTPEPITGTRFLEILASEGFVTEKNSTLMFPLSLLSTVFTQDGQRLRSHQGSPSVFEVSYGTPMLESLMKTVYHEGREYPTTWKCVLGSAQKWAFFGPQRSYSNTIQPNRLDPKLHCEITVSTGHFLIRYSAVGLLRNELRSLQRMGTYVSSSSDGGIMVHVPTDGRGRLVSVEFNDELYTYRSDRQNWVLKLSPDHRQLPDQTMTPGPINAWDWGQKSILYPLPSVYWMNSNLQGADPNTARTTCQHVLGNSNFYTTGLGVLNGEYYVYQVNPATHCQALQSDDTSGCGITLMKTASITITDLDIFHIQYRWSGNAG
ncbi:hypothetical protein FE257_013026 [Aspergillus nanangensis]|uniref:Uncharacterized protein n=1 Tax=Aspergillus nanangensis TaxID=2582783 RepID=A0AAD4CF39_ASPNN|nr:hypothetical protein FE257_013026 [Aspergillus nanangensis]